MPTTGDWAAKPPVSLGAFAVFKAEQQVPAVVPAEHHANDIFFFRHPHQIGNEFAQLAGLSIRYIMGAELEHVTAAGKK